MPEHARHRKRIDQAARAGSPMLDASRFDAANRRRLSGPGLRTFLNIADQWGLTGNERLMLLGLPGRSTYFGWISRARTGRDLTLPVDVLLRLSAVLGVHKALRILFGSEHDALSWLRDPHDAPTFGGQPPVALLTNGTQDGIMLVRRYLDAFRGGRFAVPGAIDGQTGPYADDDIVIA